MVFALRAPGQGERRVQCLEWTHPIRLGSAHLTEGRMPAALQRGRLIIPLARKMQAQNQCPKAQSLGQEIEGENRLNQHFYP